MPVVLGNLQAIGPVVVDYRNPSLSWTAAPTSKGIQPCRISGTVVMESGHTLRELCANPAAQVTKGGFTGVQEWIAMTGDALGPLTGDYLLQSFDFNPDRQFVYAGRVAFSLSAAYLGDQA